MAVTTIFLGLLCFILFQFYRNATADFIPRTIFLKRDIEMTATARVVITDKEQKRMNVLTPTVATSVIRRLRKRGGAVAILNQKAKHNNFGSKRSLPYENPHPDEIKAKSEKTDAESNKQTIPTKKDTTVKSNKNNAAFFHRNNLNNDNSNNAAIVNSNNGGMSNANNDGVNTQTNDVNNQQQTDSSVANNLSNVDDMLDKDEPSDEDPDADFDNEDTTNDNEEEDDDELSPTGTPDDNASDNMLSDSTKAEKTPPANSAEKDDEDLDGDTNASDFSSKIHDSSQDTSNLDLDDEDNDADVNDDTSPTDLPADSEKKNIVISKITTVNAEKRNLLSNALDEDKEQIGKEVNIINNNDDEIDSNKSYNELLKLEQDINDIAKDLNSKRAKIIHYKSK